MSSINDSLSTKDRLILLQIARQSIESGLHHGHALEVNPPDYPDLLGRVRASFVTLEIEEQLRGCVGILEARLPLVADVAEHAFAAAFCDPRFPRLREEEFSRLTLHISILSPPEPIQFSSEADLLAQLRPDIDGLVLRAGERRATFLPAVWQSLPDPFMFLTYLKHKAGLPLDFWSDAIEVERYTTECFGDKDMG